MAFIGSINFKDAKPPARIHIHESSTGIYGTSQIEITDNVSKYFREIVATYGGDNGGNQLKRFLYLLGYAWGDRKTNQKVIDLFGFNDINDWPGNPDVSAYVVRNGVLIRDELICCGDALILLGREEEHRRKKESLEDYMSTMPLIL